MILLVAGILLLAVIGIAYYARIADEATHHNAKLLVITNKTLPIAQATSKNVVVKPDASDPEKMLALASWLDGIDDAIDQTIFEGKPTRQRTVQADLRRWAEPPKSYKSQRIGFRRDT